jgi:glutamate racemase
MPHYEIEVSLSTTVTVKVDAKDDAEATKKAEEDVDTFGCDWSVTDTEIIEKTISSEETEQDLLKQQQEEFAQKEQLGQNRLFSKGGNNGVKEFA